LSARRFTFRFLECGVFAAVLLAGCLQTRAQNAAAPPETPPQTNLPTDAPLNPDLPTVFIVGDSTARNGVDLGWGDHLAPFFDTARINVANRARAGRSSRSYIDEGLWSHTLSEMKPGDYLLLQMGHNDGGDLDGAKPRGSLKGLGEETRDLPQTAGPYAGRTETVHTYGWYMRKMIEDAKAKGVHVVLLTLTVRNIWTTGPDGQAHVEQDMGYDGFIRQIGAAEHVPVLDPAAKEAIRLEALGQEKTAALFPKDHTHSSAEGAALIARDVVQTLRDAGSPLEAYLKSGS
jgi:rhamnogalacturonan acetylesterase